MKLSTTTGNIQKRFGTEKAIEMIAKAGFDAYDMNMARIHVADTPFSENGYMDYAKKLKNVADNFFANYPDGLLPQALSYMCSVGRYMIKQISSIS